MGWVQKLLLDNPQEHHELNAKGNRGKSNRRASFIAVIGMLAVLVAQWCVQLVTKSSVSGAAFGADVVGQPSTMPGEGEEKLAALPERISSKRVPIQVLSPQGGPLRIDSIQAIRVWIEPKMPWEDGPVPEVLGRYAEEWVLVDKEMFALAQPGQRVDLTFSTNGTAMTVTGEYPKAGTRKITFKALYDPTEIGIDLSSGPAAAKDEVAGEVVDPGGKPVAGAVVSFPQTYGDPPRKPTTTGEDGVFRFPGFGDHWYFYLQVQKAGYATRILTDLPVGRGFVVHLDDRTRLKGQLSEPDGSLASKATLTIVTSKATSRPRMGNPIEDLTVTAQTDEKGQYDVPLEPGQYEIRVAAANSFGHFNLTVPSQQVVALPGGLEAGITLKMLALDTVTNKPASGVTFYLSERSPGAISMIKGSDHKTGEDGIAKWDQLPPGPMEVGVESDVYGRWWTNEMAKEQFMRGIDEMSIDVSRGMSAVTVHMEPAVQVSGQVLSPDGKAVAGARVDIAGLQTGDARYARSTDNDGKFKLVFPILNMFRTDEGIALKYAIVASDSQHRWANATGEWFSPTAGQKMDVTLKMTEGARVRGRVVRGDGQPVVHLEVQGQADDQLDRMYYNPRTLTDDGGRFELDRMRGGQYSIYLYANPGEVQGRSDAAPAAIKVADGDRLDIGDIKYDGPAPAPVPAWYAKEYGAVASAAASTQPDEGGWRHVAPATPAGARVAAIAQQMPAGTTAVEEELLGTPATAGQLSGKVVDDKGEAIAGALVKVWTWTPERGVTTDSNGKFLLTRLDARRNVEIRFSKEGYCPRYIPQQPTGLSDLVVVLTNKTFFEGEVKGLDGKAVAGAKIRADQGPKQGDGVQITNVWTETTSDGQGNYKLFVQPDAYDIHVRVPGVGVARTGKIAIGTGEAKHLDISLSAGVTFRAVVMDADIGDPVAGIKLSNWQHPDVQGTSDAAGNLVIDGMEPGNFDFSVQGNGYARWWSDGAVSAWNRKSIEAGKFQRNFDNLDFDLEPKMDAVTIVMERGVHIRGRVVDPEGNGVAGATVAPALTGSGNSLTGDTRFSVRTSNDGTFNMMLPASGDHDYNLEAHDGDLRKWRKWANGVLPPIRTKPGQELDDITLTLTRPAVVRGRVVDADGKPVANREVRAVAGDLLENRYYDPTARTDKEGKFALKFVRAGKQFIQVAPFWLTASEAPAGSSQTVTLTESQVLEDVNLTASAGR